MIELKNVSKAYRTKGGWNQVLNNISAKFPTNKSVGILGLNGSGKSTLLRLIGGVEFPDKGSIYKDTRISWPIGFSGGIQSLLTGRENTRFIARIYGADLNYVEQFVEEFTELGIYYDMPVHSYSSGMRARLSFAVSMACEFEVYLVDELTAVGDSRFREKYQNEFIKRKERSTVVMVSHNVKTIEDFCEITAVLFNSTLTVFDTVEEGFEYYKAKIESEKRVVATQ